MTTVADPEQWREQAKQAVERFVGRFDESYRLLLYHAALPLVLTPELVNYLRNEFLRSEQVPWVAEVDLLLSDLCSQVGYELYAMDTHVRAYLLEEMEKHPRCGEQRMQKVAQVLISYVSYLSRLNPGRRQQEIEAQRWAAMVYLGGEQCKEAAREIAKRLLETSRGTGSENLTESGIRAELARLARITEELSAQLQQEPALLEYARLMQRILRTPETVSQAELNRSYRIGDEELTIPDRLLPEGLRLRAMSSSRQTVAGLEGLPPVQTFEFEVATITISDGAETSLSINLQPFEFEVALIEVNESAQINTSSFPEIVDEMIFTKTGQHLNKFEQLILQGTLANQTYEKISESTKYSARHLRNVALKLWEVLSQVLGEKVDKRNLQNVLKRWAARRHLTIHRHRQQAQEFIEDLGNGVQLEMVAIPSGSFVMGSPEDEPRRNESESPQHTVTIQSFFLGKYPVTQAQWQAVASLPQVNHELDANPSRFKGENRPVERVSWYDGMEFCGRLSQYTGKPYRLPSEAEWEYACRAGTTTPFHFGETITSELANYNADYTYGAGVKGVYRKETTPVGSFGVANAFGLYDMHGNVWEWCADHSHSDYEGAPTDGSAWLDATDNDYRVLQGGSWGFNPGSCRSASRDFYVRAERGNIRNNVGFRVVCAFGRTQ
ncbi:formylglycine-generating enzyme family protein [Mastigocladopsis repens]|uniref:formylglycine-generating enzyme family protein n=1 Tax=Mastigocladopsis repens TaxID=221287 RepID=UPI0002D2A81E|nr:formylglycine-generating enzyme family protein [Mastigocladopsis repens]